MANILEIENLQKVYGKKENITLAINNVSFKIADGEFVAIMGNSGCGKTTLLNCVSTIDRPTKGKIIVDSVDITKLSSKKLNNFRRDKLGFIFQDFNLLDTFTAYENIALALGINNKSPKYIKQEIENISKSLGIEECLKKYPYQLSGGQKQRIAAARAIITKPKLVLADEPTGALDSKSSKSLLECFNYLNSELNSTILMVTHDAFSASYSSRVIFMKDGLIISEISKNNSSQKEYYQKIVETIARLTGEDNEAL